MRVAAGHPGDAELRCEPGVVAVLAVAVVAVDRLQRLEPASGLFPARTPAAAQRAHRVGQHHGGALGPHDGVQAVDEQQLGRVAVQPEHEHVAHVGAQLHSPQHRHLVAFAQLAQSGGVPQCVVLRQAHAVEAAGRRLLRDHIRLHAALSIDRSTLCAWRSSTAPPAGRTVAGSSNSGSAAPRSPALPGLNLQPPSPRRSHESARAARPGRHRRCPGGRSGRWGRPSRC